MVASLKANGFTGCMPNAMEGIIFVGMILEFLDWDWALALSLHVFVLLCSDQRIYLTKLIHLAYCIEMSNQELINAGMKQMDETDKAIERSKQVVHQTIEVGTQTATTLKGQIEQMGRIVIELDSIQFSIKMASQLVKEIGKQVATDKCIMLLLVLIVCGVIAIIVMKRELFLLTTLNASHKAALDGEHSIDNLRPVCASYYVMRHPADLVTQASL
ncbi:putative plant SNARE [Arachis hypogaea]|nr:putative plant SNARE [Arachis hypogaea]